MRAPDYKLGSLEITQPWTRATAPTAPAGGGYLVPHQHGHDGRPADRGTQPQRSPKFELHEMTMDGNIMPCAERLTRASSSRPGATVTLKPGGLHLMFIELKAPFTRNTKVPVTLVFEKAGSIDVELLVQAMGAQH